MIILVGSQKGGTGKSTIIVNIAAELSKRKFKVVLIDADKQGTSTNWINSRNDSRYKLSKIPHSAIYGDISTHLLKLNKHPDLINIVDVAGYDSLELRTALTVADIFITPVKTSKPDLDTLPHLQSLVTASKTQAKIFLLFNMVSTHNLSKELAEAKKVVSELDFTLLKQVIRERKIYRDVIPLGLGVSEVKANKGRAEIELLVDELSLMNQNLLSKLSDNVNCIQ